MNFLLGLFIFFVSVSIIFRLFGRYIIQFLMRGLMRKMVREAENQRVQYEQNYEGRAFNENIFVDKEMKVSQPKADAKKHVSADEIAEDIEFEEL